MKILCRGGVCDAQKSRPALFFSEGQETISHFESPAPSPSPPELRPCLPSPSRLWPAATAANKATCSIIAELHSDTLQLLTSAPVPSCFRRLIAANTVLRLHLIKITHAQAEGRNCWQKLFHAGRKVLRAKGILNPAVTNCDIGLLGMSVKYGLKGRTPGNVWPRQELQEVWLHPHPGLKKDILSKRSSRLNMFSVLDSTPTIANEEEESRKSVEQQEG